MTCQIACATGNVRTRGVLGDETPVAEPDKRSRIRDIAGAAVPIVGRAPAASGMIGAPFATESR